MFAVLLVYGFGCWSHCLGATVEEGTLVETLDDYAANVERGAHAAIALAAHYLRKAGTPMSLLAAHQLELLRLDDAAMLDEAMQADGVTTRTDPRDGLRYIVAEGVAA